MAPPNDASMQKFSLQQPAFHNAPVIKWEPPAPTQLESEGSIFGTGPAKAIGNGICIDMGTGIDPGISPLGSPFSPFLLFFFLAFFWADEGSIWDLNREYRMRAAWPLEISRSEATRFQSTWHKSKVSTFFTHI